MTDEDMHRVIAAHDITQAIYRYCRAMDRIDHALGYSIWHHDGLANYGTIFQGTGTAFIDWVCAYHSTLKSQNHRMSNIIVNVNGDRATSEGYVKSTLYYVDDGRDVLRVGLGRYLDTWSYRDGRWAIDLRTFVLDFVTTEYPHAVRTGWATRDADDPSYRVLNGEDT